MKKILVVDDEPLIITSIKIGLESIGGNYEVIGANSGEECFKILEEGEKPDLILLDIMMPGMDGWKVHDKLKAKESPYNDIPIIFLTAANNEDYREVGTWFGEDYIEKPFDIMDLKKSIDRVLNKRKKD
ncbi:MAG: response regulator [Thermoplasmata archaeon]|nr:MAG: response regulator [Thermoplasmata archaeon]